MSEEEQTFKKSEKCDIKFDKNGNVTIIGDCNGEKIIRPEIAIFNKVSGIIEDEDE